jgi:hypothetical protein
VWLTQNLIAELFQTTKQNISLHLKNIFKEGELNENSVVKDFLTTASDGKNYKTKFYNLDAIISVGYRVNSQRATQFRQWATSVLRDFSIRGYVLDKERLKNEPFLAKSTMKNCWLRFGRFVPVNAGFIRKLQTSIPQPWITALMLKLLKHFLQQSKTNFTLLCTVKRLPN